MPLEQDPLWYKDAIVYQTHVRAFYDSDADGIGDFNGLTEKLDYVQDLGVTAIWILPFYPSPLKDDGYDTADYTKVHPAYGTLRDFRVFLREAHRRGLRIITELVLNHTSDQHPWFQRARHAPAGSVYRDFYVWSDTPEKYEGTRLIFPDFENSNWAWDPVARAYYWHRFYSHQPDLNFDNPRVKKALLKVVDFWFSMGVDGMRLDAVPYLYEREGTNCENLPETHDFLKELRAHVDARYENRMLLAEANQWPEEAISYFGDGDECQMAFHFPVMPRMFMSVRLEDRFPIIDILEQTPAIPANSQWALFLRNHDELTLEMVTDEERDYMYRAYASDYQARINLGIRRRLSPLMESNRRKIELMNSLLMSLPGTPIVYYGDEIGIGDNIYLGDRDAVRTPMQWSSDRNAGFSRANPQKLYLPVIVDPEYHFESVNVEAQQRNPQSLLWWMKRLIALRRRFKAFGRGTIRFLYPENAKVLAFVREYEGDTILVLANLSRFAQYVELDLSDYKGWIPTELFGQSDFPEISDDPYFISLGPHNFFWFSLASAEKTTRTLRGEEGIFPQIAVKGDWENLLSKSVQSKLENILPAYLISQRWFGGKARKIKGVHAVSRTSIAQESATALLVHIQVEYTDGEPETYLLPLAFAAGEQAEHIKTEQSNAVLCSLTEERKSPTTGVVYDAMVSDRFHQALLETIARKRVFKGDAGDLTGFTTKDFRRIAGKQAEPLHTEILQGEQSNTSVIYGNRFILKIFRRLEQGVNPDLEIGQFLGAKPTVTHAPRVAGGIEYRNPRQEAASVALLMEYVPNEGNAWNYSLDHLTQFYENVLSKHRDIEHLPLPTLSLVQTMREKVPPLVEEAIGPYLDMTRLLGRNTAELHLALASSPEIPAFEPEPFTTLYQRSVYQSMRNLTGKVFQMLKRRINHLPEEVRPHATHLLDLESQLMRRFRTILDRKLTGTRTRTHGDYHLGQVLFTGRDFVIIDFEGEPARSLTERRLKRSPLRDVAGMLRSYHYAAYTGLFREVSGGIVRPDELAKEEEWARLWYGWISAAFLRAYVEAAEAGSILPDSDADLQIILDIYLLEKAVYELGYELNNRPEWVTIPIQGILQLVDGGSE